MHNFDKKISIKFFIKSAIVLVLFIVINFTFRNLYLDIMENSVFSKSEKLLKKKIIKPVKLLVLGDSHPEWSIWDHFFDFNIFKWVTPGEGYVRNFYKLKYFLKKQKTKYVIIPVDLHSFTSRRIKRIKQDFYWVKYIDYLELGKVSKQFWYYFKKYLKGRLIPYLGESKTLSEWVIKSLSKKKNNQSKSIAGLYFSKNSKKKKVKVKKKVRSFNSLKPEERLRKSRNRLKKQLSAGESFSEIMCLYLEKMIHLCEKNKINVILVKYPVSKEYFKTAQKYLSTDLIKNKVLVLLKNKRSVRLLDLQNIFSDYPQFMADPDHVNRYGASIISRKINNYINIKEGNFKKKVFFQNSYITIISTSNIGKIEGPYKKNKLPKITWGVGPQSSIKFFSEIEQSVSLHLEYCNIFNNQKMRLIINNNFKKEFVMEKTKLGDFKKILLPLLFKKGENSIIFNYAISNKVKGRRAIAVLFSKIHIY